MRKSAARYEMDMTSGPILINMVRFAIPLMFSSILQLFYNAADMIVVGQFAGSMALAAVGATGSMTSLLVNLFMGLSVGASVTVAQHYGANRYKDVSESVHTTAALALLGGVGIGAVGIIFAPQLLSLLSTPEDVMQPAVLYMRIYFAGMPAMLLYNFCAAVLRAVGDTKRPLYYLALAGVVNVALNLVFVIVFQMSVAGVALATIISQVVSMVLVVICLVRTHSSIHLDFKKIRLHGDKAMQIIRIGFPAGLQSCMFSISNTIIQSSINSFGSIAIAGNTTAANIESFIGTPLDAFSQAAMNFVGQSYGAKKADRMHKITRTGILLVSVTGVALGTVVLLLGQTLCGFYTTDLPVIEWAMLRIRIMALSYWTGCIGNICVAGMRATGNSLIPMMMSILTICIFRIIWVFTAFAMFRTATVLYLSYPISYILSTVTHLTCYGIHMKKLIGNMRKEEKTVQTVVS